MGYFGGAGLPFFVTKFPAIKKTEETKATYGAIAKNSFQIHKQLGVSSTSSSHWFPPWPYPNHANLNFLVSSSPFQVYGKYLIPVHAGAAVFHAVRGQAIFARINPFRTPRM